MNSLQPDSQYLYQNWAAELDDIASTCEKSSAFKKKRGRNSSRLRTQRRRLAKQQSKQQSTTMTPTIHKKLMSKRKKNGTNTCEPKSHE